MNVAEALAWGRSHIDMVDARLLLQSAMALEHAQLAAHPERVLDAAQLACFHGLVERRAAGEPVAHLIGWREFFGRRFRVTGEVLIPRPETELLIETALSRLHDKPAPRVLDLGTGSGILAITLALELPQAQVVACEVSSDAMIVARDNARNLGAGVHFVQASWYEGVRRERFDLILSNPPYVAADDAHLSSGDLRFEPRGALTDGSLDGLASLRAVVSGAVAHLTGGGWLMVEHGYDQGGSVAALMHDADLHEVRTLQDLAGQDRISIGQVPGCDCVDALQRRA